LPVREPQPAGVPIQINTLVAAETVDETPAIYELLKTFPVMRWSLFFLIEVGRARCCSRSPASAANGC
jgi:MoaA/NifB/PqqE/SkfB family radical SAM enzyme